MILLEGPRLASFLAGMVATAPINIIMHHFVVCQCVSECSFFLPLPNRRIALHSIVWYLTNVVINTKVGYRRVASVQCVELISTEK